MTNGSEAVRRLAGLSPATDRVRGGLPEREIVELCDRVAVARTKAGMTANRFLALDRAALKAFCVRYGFNRGEIRLAQCLIAVMRAMNHTSRVAEIVQRARAQGARGVH